MKYSFVTIGRDDDYGAFPNWGGPYFHDRAYRCLDSLKLLGGDTEIIFVSQGSYLKDKLPEGVRLIEVPVDKIQTKYPQATFPLAYLYNIGVRQAQGEMIVVHAADDIFGSNTLDLIDQYGGKKKFLYIAKFYTGTENEYNGDVYWKGTKNAREMLDILWPQRATWAYHDPFNKPPGTTGYDVLIMHRDDWYAMRGFEECMWGRGWLDQQLVYRAAFADFDVIDLAPMGGRLWHMDHMYANGSAKAGGEDNPRVMAGFTCNDENWGTL